MECLWAVGPGENSIIECGTLLAGSWGMYRNDLGAALARIAQLVSELSRVQRLLAEATRVEEVFLDSEDIGADDSNDMQANDGGEVEIGAEDGLAPGPIPFKPMEHTFPEQEPSPPELFSRTGEIRAMAKTHGNEEDLPSVLVSLQDWQ